MANRKYLILLRNQRRGEAEKEQQQAPSPEQMQKMFAAYKAWQERFKDQIFDMGDKLEPGGRVVQGSTVQDGPFVEAKEVIGGYMIVTAEDYEAAVEVVRAMPASQMSGISLEIRELSKAQM